MQYDAIRTKNLVNVLFANNKEAELLGNLSLKTCYTWKFVPNEELIIYVVITIYNFSTLISLKFVSIYPLS